MNLFKLALLTYLTATAVAQTCTCAQKMVWDSATSRCKLCCAFPFVDKVHPALAVGECNCVAGYYWSTDTTDCQQFTANFCKDTTITCQLREKYCGACLDINNTWKYNFNNQVNYSLTNSNISWTPGIPSTLSIANPNVPNTTNITLVFNAFTTGPNFANTTSSTFNSGAGIITFTEFVRTSYVQRISIGSSFRVNNSTGSGVLQAP